MLVTERDGDLRVIRNGKLDPNPVAGGPAAFFTGESGLPGAVHGYMDIALHPQFAQNQLLYLSYTKPLAENRTTFAVARMRWTGSALADVKDVLVADDTTAAPTPIVFGRDGMLYIATSGGDAQDGRAASAARCCACTTTAACRATTRSSAEQATRPAIYSLGHRSSLGPRLASHTGDSGRARTARTAATSSTSSAPARTTAGRS